jgi:inner membrane protein
MSGEFNSAIATYKGSLKKFFIAIATAGTSLILGTANPLPLGLAIIGSQLPDLDTTTSTVGKIFFPISSWIEDRFPHRSVTHCLLATVAIAIVSISIGYFLGDIKTALKD